MAWHARLRLDLQLEAGRSVARFEHDGPLRILQPLYPEGDAICHNVLVHPPGGLVGGDEVEIDVRVGEGAHGLLTTPGAARFYRSEGAAAVQKARLSLARSARFEWLPQEAICYSGCMAENHLQLDLASGAEVIGWDICALGLPESGRPFVAGSLLQHLALGEHWLERGRIAADNHRLLDGPLGFAGNRCLATLFLACGSDPGRERREQALVLARDAIGLHALAASAGATSPVGQVVVVRVLAPLVEPAVALLKSVRSAWRRALWNLDGADPRLWSV